MSWSLHAVPLHELANDGMLNWATSVGFSRGVPDRAPKPLPLPSVVDVLAAFKAAGCHGTAWFKVFGEDPASSLAECPGSDACFRSNGLDLGEVNVQVVGHVHSVQVPPDAAVESIAFRKPVGVAVLAALCALALTAGPQLVFDDSADSVFVVWPGERRDDLIGEWPW